MEYQDTSSFLLFFLFFWLGPAARKTLQNNT